MQTFGKVLFAAAALAAGMMLVAPASAQGYYYGDARSGVYVGPPGHGHVRPGPHRQRVGVPRGPVYYQSPRSRRHQYATPAIAGFAAGAIIASQQRHSRTVRHRSVVRTPSPAQIAASVPHRVTRVPAPCARGYAQDDGGWCHRTRWVPGP